jgi:hypothetical protein
LSDSDIPSLVARDNPNLIARDAGDVLVSAAFVSAIIGLAVYAGGGDFLNCLAQEVSLLTFCDPRVEEQTTD